MHTIRLYGPMGVRFGRVHAFHLSTGTTAEAFAALGSQVEGFRRYLLDAAAKGVRFAVFVGKRNLAREHLGLPANDEIRVVVVPAGAKRQGMSQIIGGILVLAATFALDAYTQGGFSKATKGAGYATGWAMIFGGAVQMLVPLPHGKSAKDKPDQQASYYFNSPVNTQAQGSPVPLLYGRRKVGSIVISAGIDTRDTSYNPSIGRSGGNPKIGRMGGGYYVGNGAPYIDLP